MRSRLVSGLLVSLVSVVLLVGCEPAVRRGSRAPAEYRRSGWFHVIKKGGTLVGYVERRVSSEDDGKVLRFVYDTRLNKVGFITPNDFAFRFNEDGNREEIGLYPEPGMAEAALLRVKDIVSIVPPLRRKKP